MPGNAIAIELFRRCATFEGIRMESLEAAMRIFNIKQIDRAEAADKVLLMVNQSLKQKRIKLEHERESAKNQNIQSMRS